MTKKREQLEADQMVAKLESGESEEYSSLSSLVRDSFEYDFPESSSELEEAVLNELADVDSRIAVKPVPPVKPSSNRRKWALVATLLLSITALGAVFTTNEFMNSQSEVPMTASVAPESGIAAADISEAEQGRLGFHNYHDANKPLADSNSLWRRPQDRFSVPYTEETVQNYSVTVPDGGTVLLGGIRRSEEHLWYSQPNSFHRHRSINLPQRSTDSYAFFEELGEEYPGFDPNVRYFQILGEQKGGEQYHPIQENEFYRPLGEAAVSTFSIDVDTGAYSNMRRFVNAGRLPPADAVRIEELVNYFDYDYEQPRGDEPFAVNMELAACPWNEDNKLLRIGLKGREIEVDERPPTNVVFLIDVSGSMDSQDKLPLLKRGFQMMVDRLNENDRVSIVTYAGDAGVALEPISGDRKREIKEAIESLTPGGSTHGSAGIELAYRLAHNNFILDGANKVILATDGDLNVGITEDQALVDFITQKASEGVFLTVLGFGTGNLQDGKMEQMADHGNGSYAYIDSIREAHKVLIEQMSGSLVTIAKDVKIQVEFNPAEVTAYRLIGYENRMMATEDFNDDTKDAGEIGAGHTVTALYEIVPTGGAAAQDRVQVPDGLRYQLINPEVLLREEEPEANLSVAAQSGELCSLALRYKLPDENESHRLDFTIENDDVSFSAASDDFQFAASVASFGMLLRGSRHSGIATPALVEEIAAGALGDDRSGYRSEFVDLVRRVKAICEQ